MSTCLYLASNAVVLTLLLMYTNVSSRRVILPSELLTIASNGHKSYTSISAQYLENSWAIIVKRVHENKD